MSYLYISGSRGDTATLRSAKSEESLSSLHNVEGTLKGLHETQRDNVFHFICI